MSVEISGPQGYEYQYLITAFIAVIAYGMYGASCQLVVEPLKGEDAELHCEIGTVYIQAKSFSDALDAKKMLEWLKHAPRRSSSLWQKVSENEGRYALIVTSSRCSDAVCSFQRPIDLTDLQHNISPLSSQLASEILEGIAQHDDREKTNIKATAKRIIVWEQMSYEFLLEKIQNEISCLGIARSQGGSVIEDLLKAVREARDTRSDCFSQVVKILDRWRVW